MADQTNPPANASDGSEQPRSQQKPEKKKSWVKRIAIGGAVVIVLLLVLVALLPTIASTGAVRGYILGKANDVLKGDLSASDWSIGWTGGVEIRDLQLKDEQGKVVVTIKRVSTELSLIDAMKGKYDLGTTVLEDPNFSDFLIDDDGQINFVKLLEPAEPGPAEPDAPAGESGGPLPQVSGVLQIKNPTGTIVAAGVPQKLFLKGGNIEIKLNGLNEAISNDITLKCAVGDRPEGTISLKGAMKLFTNDEFDAEKLTADQVLTLSGLDMGAIAPFLKMGGVEMTLAGTADGSIQANVNGLSNLGATGGIKIAQLAAGGDVLNGDTFKTSVLEIPVKVSQAGDKIDADVAVIIDAGRVQLTADAPQEALKAALELIPAALNHALTGEKPQQTVSLTGGTGSVNFVIDLDAAQVVNQLPNTIKLEPGTTIRSGRLAHNTTLTIEPERAPVSTTTTLSGVRGELQGEAIELQPIELTASLNALPGSSPDVRDIKLNLSSAFLNLNGGGASMQDVNIAGKFDLSAMQKELSQFVPIEQYIAPAIEGYTGKTFTDAGRQNLHMAGTGDLTVKLAGNVSTPNSPIDASLWLVLTDVRLGGVGDEPQIDQKHLLVAASGKIERDAEGAGSAMRGSQVVVELGPQESRILEVAANADVNLADGTVPAFEIGTFRLDVAAAGRDVAALAARLSEMGIDVQRGVVTIDAAGAYDGKIAQIARLVVSQQGVTLNKTEEGTSRNVLRDYSSSLKAAGRIELGDTTVIRLSQLDLSDSHQLLTLKKAGDAEVVVRLPSEGELSAQGVLELMADLRQAMELSNAFSGVEEPVGLAKGPELRSGVLSGTIDFAHGVDLQSAVTANLAVKDLSVTTYGQPIGNEQVKLVIRARAAGDFSTVNAERVEIDSSFLKANIDGAELLLADAPTAFDMVKTVKVAVDVPDLPRMMAIVDAFTPPAEAIQAADTGAADEQPLPPIQWTGGKISTRASLTREGDSLKIDLTELKGNDVAFTRGAAAYAARPFDVRLSALVSTTPEATIRELRVNDLLGRLGIAELSLQEPIVITDPSGTMAASGAVKLAGEIQQIAHLLDALQGTRPGEGLPYAGALVVTQKISSSNGGIALTGGADVDGFRVLDAKGKEVFAEKSLKLANDVSIDEEKSNLVIRNVRLSMESSKALDVTINGQLLGYDSERRFDNIQLDLGYDAEKVWAILQPMMATEPNEEPAISKIAGKYRRQWVLNGTYPADKPFHEAIQSLTGSGGIALDLLEAKGFTIEDVNERISLERGKVAFSRVPATQPTTQQVAIDGEVAGGAEAGANRPATQPATAPTSRPAAIIVNGGTLQLDGVVLDLSKEHPTVTTPPNHPLLTNVRLNPILSDNVFGKFNSLFVNPKRAGGMMTVLVERCENLPIDEVLTNPAAGGRNAPRGSAQFNVSMENLDLANNFVNTMMALFKRDLRADRLQGNIRDARIGIANGVVTQDLTVYLDRYPLQFKGGVNLTTSQYSNMSLIFPPELLSHFDEGMLKYLPKGIPVPLRGNVSSPQVAVDEVAPRLAAEAGAKMLLDRNTRRSPQDEQGTKKDEKKSDDPVGDLIDILGGNRNKDRNR